MPKREPMTALWRLASAKMMLGDLPPSSRDIFLTLLAAARITCLPTSVEPVKAILSTSSEAAKRSPVAPAAPVITFTTPAGGPAPLRMRPRSSGVPGRDDPDDAYGLFEDQPQRIVHVVGDDLPLHVQGEPGVVIEHVGRHDHFHARLAEGLADLRGEEAGEVGLLLADLVGGLAEDLRALAGRRLWPAAAIEGGARGPNGGG